MSKTYCDSIVCDEPHRIFYGRNALYHALFFIETGKVASSADQIYYFSRRPIKLDHASYWTIGDKHVAVQGLHQAGKGVHAKMYIYKGKAVLSSQNAATSPLYEFAIVYHKRKSKMPGIIRSMISKAKLFSEWYKSNGKFLPTLKRVFK